MKKFIKLGAVLCTVMLALMLASFTQKPQDEEPALEGTWYEVFYEFNFDGNNVKTKKYNFGSWLSNQERWVFTAKGENEYTVTWDHWHLKSHKFIDDGSYDIKVVDSKFVTEFEENFKITNYTGNSFVLECYNGNVMKERKTFRKAK